MKRHAQRRREMILVFAIGFLTAVFCVAVLKTILFYYTVTFRSPIIMRSPVVIDKRSVISPQPTKSSTRHVTPKNSPTPPFAPKRRSLAPVVYAAETNGDVVKEYIVEKFGADAPQALKVAQCESGTQAYNWYSKFLGVTAEEANERGYAVGVFMVYRKVHAHLSFEDMLDYKKNIDYAYELFKTNGWSPWNASKNCWI